MRDLYFKQKTRLAWMIISHILSLLAIYSLCGLSVFCLSLCYLLSLGVGVGGCFLQCFKTQFLPLHDLNDDLKGRSIKRLWTCLLKRVNCAGIPLRCLLRDQNPRVRFYAITWPFSKQVILSEEAIELFLSDFSHTDLASFLLHELGHIHRGDSFYGLLMLFFRKSLLSLVFLGMACALFWGLMTWVSLILALGFFGLMTFSNEMICSGYHQTCEKLADIYALYFTSPDQMVRSFFTLRFSHLHWGRVLDCDGQFVSIKNKRLVDSLKKKCREVKQNSAPMLIKQWQEINAHLEHAHPSKGLFYRSWFPTHPSLEERAQDCLTKFPRQRSQ